MLLQISNSKLGKDKFLLIDYITILNKTVKSRVMGVNRQSIIFTNHTELL